MKKFKYIIDDYYVWVQDNHTYIAWFYKMFYVNRVEIWDATMNVLVFRRSNLSDPEINLMKCNLKRYHNCKKSFDENAIFK